LRAATFRNLLVADIASDVGTFMQGVAAAWMMVSLNAGPLYVALTQTASALPFFVLALPAGALGDIVDRRKLILFTEVWMALVAIVLAGVTLAGWLSPVLLLILTFALSAGDAMESPTWRAVLPELVSQEDLPAAGALNGIEFNFARAIGPALGGVVIAVANAGVAFLVNAASFLGVIFVVARWKRAVPKRTTPPETVAGASVAAIRYVRYSPAIRVLVFRSGILMFFASGLLALLPSLAHAVSSSPIGYGLLLGCFGLGAVLGAAVMQQARARWSPEAGGFERHYDIRRDHCGRGQHPRFPATRGSHAGWRCSMDSFHLALQCTDSESRTRVGARSGACCVDAGFPRGDGRWKRRMGRACQQDWHTCRPVVGRRGDDGLYSHRAIAEAAGRNRRSHALDSLAAAHHRGSGSYGGGRRPGHGDD
jgi:MFS family permease